jgi:negative regulator of flagellin synthesis FlgM
MCRPGRVLWANKERSMKIGPLDLKQLPAAAAGDRKPAAQQPAANEPSARVELSSQAALRGQDAVRADFDSAKVERIAQAIRDGTFKINAEVIADKLIANAQDLLVKPTR